jgi:hypothetical protein
MLATSCGHVLFDLVVFTLILVPFLIIFAFGWSAVLVLVALYLMVSLIMWPMVCCCNVQPLEFEPHRYLHSFIVVPSARVWHWRANTGRWIRGLPALEPIPDHDPDAWPRSQEAPQQSSSAPALSSASRLKGSASAFEA